MSSYSTRQPSASTDISPGQAAKRSPRLCSTGAFKDKPGACLTSSQPPLSSNPSNPLKHRPGGIYYENDTEPQLFGELFGLRFTHGLHVSSANPWHVLALLRFKSHKLGKKKDASAGCLNPYTISAQAVWTELLLHEVAAYQVSNHTPPSSRFAGPFNFVFFIRVHHLMYKFRPVLYPVTRHLCCEFFKWIIH